MPVLGLAPSILSKRQIGVGTLHGSSLAAPDSTNFEPHITWALYILSLSPFFFYQERMIFVGPLPTTAIALFCVLRSM